MAVIFINQFFHPDVSATSQLLSDLAFDLSRKGRRVHVIASRLRYEDPARDPTRLVPFEIVEGVHVHRVWTSWFGRRSLYGRALDSLTFYMSMLWRLWLLTKRGDVLVAKTDPPLISVIACVIARMKDARLINWLQDLFPEVAQALGIGRRGRLGYAILAWARNHSLRCAACNVAIGRRMAARLNALNVGPERIQVIPNWVDTNAIRPVPHSENPFRRQVALDGSFVVAYSGNLGRVHDIATLLEAMTTLHAGDTNDTERPADATVLWLFIGGGALTPLLKKEVARRQLQQVTFMPYQPRSALTYSLSAADLHLVSLRPEFEGLVVPSKVTGATSAGRPILFIGDQDGEIGQMIARYDCGFIVGPGEGRTLAQVISEAARAPERLREIGRRSRQACEAEFDRGRALARWDELIDRVARSPSP